MAKLLSKNSSRVIALRVVAFLLVGLISVPVYAVAVGQVLAPQQFYQLVAKPLVAGGGFQLPNPGVDVSLNPCPLPPGGTDPNTSMDLTNPGSPVYTQPGPGPGDQFSYFEINWGMDLGFDGVMYSIPGNPVFNGDIATFSFFAQGTDANQAPTGDKFRIDFQIGGPNPIDPASFVSLNPCPLPPFPDPNIQGTLGLQFQFSQLSDPILVFQMFDVTLNDAQFGFAPVPEPGTLALLGIGLAAAYGLRKHRKTA